jgi:phenylalanyl-tRNA synthetase alpha chain
MSNIPSSLKSKIGLQLHNKLGHPIKIIKDHIYEYFLTKSGIKFEIFDTLDSIVDVENNFDLLLISESHPSRSKSDTYYIDDTHVLRTHTSAHQNELLKQGHKSFLVTGDVYRKDEIDSKHYNIFHQMEGVHILQDDQDPVTELKKILSELVTYLFPDAEYRFNSDYFPFTDPSFEIEVKFDNKWMEILGCGVVHRRILDRLGIKQQAIAFGAGIERLAMIFFDIPDIRLFWTDDKRFSDQFKDGKITKFKPYPKLAAQDKDISFWINAGEIISTDICNKKSFIWTNINNFYEIVRDVCDTTILSVGIMDQFYHTKLDKYSMTFKLIIEPKDLVEGNHSKVSEYANSCVTNIVSKLTSLGYTIR